MVPPAKPDARAAVSVNGRGFGEWVLGAAPGSMVIKLERPLVASGNLTIVLDHDNPASPAELGFNADARKLGIGLQAINIRKAP